MEKKSKERTKFLLVASQNYAIKFNFVKTETIEKKSSRLRTEMGLDKKVNNRTKM